MSQRKRGNFKGKTKDVDLFRWQHPTASDTFDRLKTRHKTYELVSYVVKPKKDKRRRTEEEEDSSVQSLPIERHQRKQLILKRDRTWSLRKGLSKTKSFDFTKVKTGVLFMICHDHCPFQYLNLKITGAEVLKGLPVLRQWLQCTV